MERALFILFFLPLGVINDVNSPYKKKNYNPDNETCVHGRRLFLPYFFLNKITLPIFQIIYIRSKTLDPCVKGGLERRRKGPSLSPGSCYFLTLPLKREEAPGTRLHKF